MKKHDKTLKLSDNDQHFQVSGRREVPENRDKNGSNDLKF